MPKGRPPKPTAELKVTGNFRKGRHGNRDKSPQYDGEPIKPRGLNDDEKWLWDQVVKSLSDRGVARKIDTACLLGMCEMWGLYRESVREAKSDPINQKARTAATSYWKEFCSMAAKFGIEPASRTKLQVQEPEQKLGFSARKRA